MFDARDHLVDLPPFEFIDLDGEQRSLPNIGTLTGNQIMRIDANDLTVIRDLDADAYEALMRMPVQVAEVLARAWLEHGSEAGKAVTPRSSNARTPQRQTRSRRASSSAR